MYDDIMTVHPDEIKFLKGKILKLESRLDEFITEYRKTIRCAGDCDDLLAARCDVIDNYITDLFDRIANIELKYFPKLGKDLRHLDGIIGEGDQKAYNPLDFRGTRHRKHQGRRRRPPSK